MCITFHTQKEKQKWYNGSYKINNSKMHICCQRKSCETQPKIFYGQQGRNCLRKNKTKKQNRKTKWSLLAQCRITDLLLHMFLRAYGPSLFISSILKWKQQYILLLNEETGRSVTGSDISFLSPSPMFGDDEGSQTTISWHDVQNRIVWEKLSHFILLSLYMFLFYFLLEVFLRKLDYKWSNR